MESSKAAIKLQGLQTVDIIQKKLEVKKSTALKIISQLRRAGYVKTTGGGKQTRLYEISPTPYIEIGYLGLYEMINKYSPIKLASQYEHRVSKPLTIEETIVRAAQSESIRIIIAALSLFRYVENWSRLGKLATEAGIGRHIGALYDASRTILRVRKMDKRTRNKLLKSKIKSKFLIKNFKSKDLKEIEQLWNIFVPFNRADLRVYKEWQ